MGEQEKKFDATKYKNDFQNSSVLSVYGGEDYMPAMRSYNTNIALQYLRVHYD